MRLALVTLLCAFHSSTVARACTCAWTTACQGPGGNAYPVFLGTVLEVTDVSRGANSEFLSTRKTRLRVDESFGGLAPDTREVEVYSGKGGGDCGVPFRPGEVYLVRAHAGKEGRLSTSICSDTRRLEYAGAALRTTRLFRDGKPVPSLAGRIARSDRDFESPWGIRESVPLPGILVRVRAGEQVYETRSDSDGLFEFYALPAGKYQFAPDLPPGMALDSDFGSDGPRPVEVRRPGCEERNVRVVSRGSVQGRVLDAANRPLPYAQVFIVPAGTAALPNEREGYWVSQRDQKPFQFDNLPPGSYLLVVNPTDKQDPAFPYRRTFYPGVRERTAAGLVTLGTGEQVKDANIRVAAEFAPRELTVRVTWADGRVIRSYVSVSATAIDKPAALARTRQPNSKASIVELSLLPNEPYRIAAELTCLCFDLQPDSQGRRTIQGPGAALRSDTIHLSPDDVRKELVLTLPASACPEIPGKMLLTERERP